ncbi:MAG: hypothetical protein ABFD05_02795, partial [Anaerolineaceae bacterium]
EALALAPSSVSRTLNSGSRLSPKGSQAKALPRGRVREAVESVTVFPRQYQQKDPSSVSRPLRGGSQLSPREAQDVPPSSVAHPL